MASNYKEIQIFRQFIRKHFFVVVCGGGSGASVLSWVKTYDLLPLCISKTLRLYAFC